ncbi:hypothetical protein NLG97_g7857 [Lecanicillium saksenae]|uniref:Uncharacterized protein n=1 Tax=Lecanicillium saksenae TaxID=468837 RepID=A0ACC1QPF8_9HYPO|nr:hypothetical protein NLG97_g7857 [Lecanicillium saksenae]
MFIHHLLVLFIAFQPYLVAITLFYHQTRKARADGHAAQRPPHQAHVAGIQAETVHCSSNHRPNRPRRAAHALAQPMHSAQHARVRRAVVDEDRHAGQRKRPARDLHEQRAADGEPHGDARLGRRRRHGARHHGQVRHDEVRQREAKQRQPPRADGAQARGQRRVQEQLHQDADDAEDGHGHADALRGHAQAAGEAERQARRRGRGRRVVDRRREEHEPERVEGADVERQEELRKERQNDVASKDLTKRQTLRVACAAAAARLRGGASHRGGRGHAAAAFGI